MARSDTVSLRPTRRVTVPRTWRRRPLGRWLIARRRELVARAERRRLGADLAEVDTCVVTLGHVKSGGSLLGALLDAHPAVAFGDEVDIVAAVDAGLDRDRILALLVRGARREVAKGRVTARRLEPYSLSVPGQWQGRYARLRVVGDSRAGPTTRSLGQDPGRLDRLLQVMAGTRVAFLHVVRNPFEPIGAMVRRSGRTLDDAIADHRAQCLRLEALRRLVPSADLVTVRYEDLLDDPRRHLPAVLRFLDLDLPEGYMDACQALLHDGAVRDRDRIAWSPEALAAVAETIVSFDFLAGYGYGS